MPLIEILKPVDAALGKRRLLNDLKRDLDGNDFTDFRWLVAYAKAGPLQRLKSRLEAWRANGRTIRAILGIDQQGTSREALELALSLCDEVYVTQERGITFHPKAYIFTGCNKARLYLGSNNLTVGGTETNFEAAIMVEASLPADNNVLAEINDLWDQLTPAQCVATRMLDGTLLKQLVANGDVVDEATLRKTQVKASISKKASTPKTGLKLKPPSPLPAAAANTAPATSVQPAPAPTAAQRFAIQIRTRPNEEIHLSVLAAFQNPAFFKFPFNGSTTPKKSGNPSYPQLVPDPQVDIEVFAAGGTPIYKVEGYGLNTVYYEKNSEIRITVAKLHGIVPDYSVMLMEPDPRPGIDYKLTIHTPQSSQYSAWVAACNQKMPGGGKTPRKFGWF